MAECVFCKIVKGDIPSLKLWETDKTLAFLDIAPLSMGHSLIIPKYHGEKLTDVPIDQLSEVLEITQALASASKADCYNILQNNGRRAHQAVDHVHFHFIPKPKEEDQGLHIEWPIQKPSKDELESLQAHFRSELSKTSLAKM